MEAATAVEGFLAPARPRADTRSSCLSSHDGDAEQQQEETGKPLRGALSRWLHTFKTGVLVCLLIACVVIMSFIKEGETTWTSLRLNDSYYLPLEASWTAARVSLRGPFLPQSLLNTTGLIAAAMSLKLNGTLIAKPFRLPAGLPAHDLPMTRVDKVFQLAQHGSPLVLELYPEGEGPLELELAIAPLRDREGMILAAALLVGLYVLIIFELVHRTLAALVGATLAVTALSLVGERPSLDRVVSWLDVETLSLLFGMMVLVAILCETGVFDATAVLAYRVARGRVWSVLLVLCLISGATSAFLDNVTTILLMTPVTIKLCEVMGLDPKHVLILMVVYSNIGGAATPVGDPPNVIIISNPKVQSLGINFASFTLHMLPAVLLSALATWLYVRFWCYRDPAQLRFKDPPEFVGIQHEIDVWRKAVCSLSEYSRDESHVRELLSKKVRRLERQQSRRTTALHTSDDHFRENLRLLSDKYHIRNRALLVKSGLVLGTVILLFFAQTIPGLQLSLGWIAILGAITLLLLADLDELEGVIARVEWPTLIFFGALFVVMEALSELKLLWYVGEQTEAWIRSVPPESRLIVAICIIVWVSAVASSFVDNIPLATVMVKIVTGLGSEELGLSLTPLVYALAFGSCLGGNGTLIGASANVVCAGVAEQHGYKFTFMDFFRVGFPVMLITTSISTGWLLICHVLLQWDD
ncbi:P protein-like [Ornithodoros turicata]|uniref:P protein-like n=1 Tax=Ornithodoros turicata TaxID=34597 RepID=UPI003138EBFF